MGDPRPFGGKLFCFGGNFRQTPPVLSYLDRDAVVPHMLPATSWWTRNAVQRFELTKNMRANEDQPYADFCLQVGNGTLADASNACVYGGKTCELSAAAVQIPQNICAPPSWSPACLLD